MDLYSVVSQHHLKLGFAYWTPNYKTSLKRDSIPL